MGPFVLFDRHSDPAAGRISSYFSKLFILTGNTGFFRYGLLDTEKNSVIALADYRLENVPKDQEYLDEIRKLIASDEILAKKHPSVIIGIDSPYHTLVPEAFFTPEQSNAYLEFNFRLPDPMMNLTDRVEELGAVNLSAIPDHPGKLLSEVFPGAAFVHGSTAMIRAFFLHHKDNPGNSAIYLHVKSHSIDLAAFADNKLIYFNSFLIDSKEDILYFTLNLAEQLSLVPGHLHLYLSGSVDPGSEIHLLLEKYIRQISYTDSFSTLKFSLQSESDAVRNYFGLLGLTLCGS